MVGWGLGCLVCTLKSLTNRYFWRTTYRQTLCVVDTSVGMHKADIIPGEMDYKWWGNKWAKWVFIVILAPKRITMAIQRRVTLDWRVSVRRWLWSWDLSGEGKRWGKTSDVRMSRSTLQWEEKGSAKAPRWEGAWPVWGTGASRRRWGWESR